MREDQAGAGKRVLDLTAVVLGAFLLVFAAFMFAMPLIDIGLRAADYLEWFPTHPPAGSTLSDWQPPPVP
jgi:hypothetical protein